MNLFFKLVTFIFLVSVVQSIESDRNVKSFKLNEKIIYDCVDIYKQPSLSHPLLKNHKIQVNPSLFDDGRTWSYGFWKGANGAGCYNTICPGFIQVSTTDPLSVPFPYPRKGDRAVNPSISQDYATGHWWTILVRATKKDIKIGYWPKELFDIIGRSVDMVGVTGVVQASPSGISPPMGNGHLPTQKEDESARVKNLLIVDTKYNFMPSRNYKLEKLLDNNKCYGLKDGKKPIFAKEYNLFTYGGPGGDSCGI
ncbi:uncharacterized protein LOC103846698 isoform X3 [Brassica rapa]|uniref:uncharacterized protein LOC103846698 isoform X3 n=1 Tax=Brassica campestris TaxID=3711 RepID=UPI00142DB95B|nr:uncharacterized protein LOC103846698 isoform X3 [Brassica rapa]